MMKNVAHDLGSAGSWRICRTNRSKGWARRTDRTAWTSGSEGRKRRTRSAWSSRITGTGRTFWSKRTFRTTRPSWT